MKHHFMSRKHFLWLSVLGGMGALGLDCTLPDEDEPGDGSAGSGGSTLSGGTQTATGGSNTTSTATGSAGSSGASTTGGGTGGNGGTDVGGSGGTGGTGGSGGSTGGSAGSGGSGGVKDAGADAKTDAGALCSTNVNANISMNHTGALHALIIPIADIRTGTAKVYVTTTGGTTPHVHYVQVTAADFTALKAGMTVTKYSCNAGDHEYVLKCGGTTDMGGAPNCGDAANMCGATNTTYCK